ncbi:MAG: hypothetical protein Ta2B_02470 [Termitinemataceae bacterium]|nr:MAG: hypothetical protein Ta2B_02470 [Termitinemataceae bacterium]
MNDLNSILIEGVAKGCYKRGLGVAFELINRRKTPNIDGNLFYDPTPIICFCTDKLADNVKTMFDENKAQLVRVVGRIGTAAYSNMIVLYAEHIEFKPIQEEKNNEILFAKRD